MIFFFGQDCGSFTWGLNLTVVKETTQTLVHVRNIDEWYTVKTALAVTLIKHDPGCITVR
jgi:hypothetical protein